MDLSAGAAIRENPGSAWYLLVLLVLVLVLLVLRRRLLLFYYVWSHFVMVLYFLPVIQCVRTSYMGSYNTTTCVVFIVALCNAARVCALACCSEVGWTTIYLKNTYPASSDTGFA